LSRSAVHMSRWLLGVAAVTTTFLILAQGIGRERATPPAAQWKQIAIPEAWERGPRGEHAHRDGYGWYRVAVKLPAATRAAAADEEPATTRLFIEPVDHAYEVYFNGRRIGAAGSLPPTYRSGLGGQQFFDIDPKLLRPGKPNLVALRVYDTGVARRGFNVAAPVLFVGERAWRLGGKWQFAAGDDPAWARLEAGSEPPTFSQSIPADTARRELRRIAGASGPLPPDEALRQFQVADDLVLEQVLAEPHIGQPVFFNFDERGRLWVLQYLQYPDPAGLEPVSRDKYLRTVYDKTPRPPPNHVRGRDKITIHEDTNGDGRYDRHKTFVEGLNIATSFVRGRGGVWVLNPPYLLFYPDRDNDDRPDGDPEVHLAGFGLEDSHSVVNSLRWGPDGWLYAAQGSTVTGHVRRPGSKDPPVHSMGQLIWRYHPTERRYEIFAEGGGNTFGVEIDRRGRIFSGHNGGDTRGFHYVQGGYSQKGFGKHGSLSNPYAFGYFPAMKHAKVPRFTHNFVIYEGAALPERYHGKLFGIAPLQSHVVLSEIKPLGSTFETRDVGHPLKSSDPWFRPVDIKAGFTWPTSTKSESTTPPTIKAGSIGAAAASIASAAKALSRPASCPTWASSRAAGCSRSSNTRTSGGGKRPCDCSMIAATNRWRLTCGKGSTLRAARQRWNSCGL